VPQFIVSLQQWGALSHPGVIHKDVWIAPEACARIDKQFLDTRSIRDIANESECFGPCFSFYFLRDVFDLLRRSSSNGHARAFTSKRQGNGATNAATPAGYQGNSIRQFHETSVR
jgi:hypothetical protein